MNLHFAKAFGIGIVACAICAVVLAVSFATSTSAMAQQPAPNVYYFSASSSTVPPAGSFWVKDTKRTEGEYKIFMVINVTESKDFTTIRINGEGPSGVGDYIMKAVIQPGGEDDIPLAYFYVKGL